MATAGAYRDGVTTIDKPLGTAEHELFRDSVLYVPLKKAALVLAWTALAVGALAALAFVFTWVLPTFGLLRFTIAQFTLPSILQLAALVYLAGKVGRLAHRLERLTRDRD